MNAVVFADGFLQRPARRARSTGWGSSGAASADLAGMPRSIMRAPGISDGWAVDNDPAFMMLDIMTRICVALRSSTR